MNLVRESAEVFWARGEIAWLGASEIQILKNAVEASPRGRVRINIHPHSEDRLHEMFIAIRSNSYIRPHKHETKSESFHLIHGEVDVVVFDDCGQITRIVPLAAVGDKGSFYYRMSGPRFHTLLIKSDVLIMHEITNGPFRPGETILAPFAPDEGNVVATTAYLEDLRKQTSTFCGRAT